MLEVAANIRRQAILTNWERSLLKRES